MAYKDFSSSRTKKREPKALCYSQVEMSYLTAKYKCHIRTFIFGAYTLSFSIIRIMLILEIINLFLNVTEPISV